MSSTTPNIGLTLPTGTEGWKRSVINGNFAILDTKIGAVGNTSLQSQINTLSSQIAQFDTLTSEWAQINSPVTFAPPKNFGVVIFKIPTTATTAQTSIGWYLKQNGYVVFSWVGTPSSYLTVTTSGGNITLATTAGNGSQAACIGFA